MSSLNLPGNPLPGPLAAPAPSITGLSTVNPLSEARPAQMQRRQRTPQEAKNGWWWGTGRRKRAVARVRIKPNAAGTGTIQVQIGGDKFKPLNEYFVEMRDQVDASNPLRVTDTLGKMDVVCRIAGGGFMGQAQAVRLGIARALRDYDPSLEDALRGNGFLTRDAREVERKKYGQAGARRRFQFSKR
jgi:small subunit ribosomal protein S9